MSSAKRGSGPMLPLSGENPALAELRRLMLRNGLAVLVIEHGELPLVEISLVIEGGSANDAPNARGLAWLGAELVAHGANAARGRPDSEFTARVMPDATSLESSLRTEALEPALETLARLLRSQAFEWGALEDLKRARLNEIERERSLPRELATRILPHFVFGPGHPYGGPRSGSGTYAADSGLTPGALSGFCMRRLIPEQATLIIVGRVSADRLRPALERTIGRWPASGRRPERTPITSTVPVRPRLLVIDEPGAPQSAIFAACAAPTASAPEMAALLAANTVVGGMLSARLNLNLREAKGWTYGASSLLLPARGPGLLIVSAMVRKEMTAQATAAIAHELMGPVHDRPITGLELRRAVDYLRLGLPGVCETNAQISGLLRETVALGRQDDYGNAMLRKLSRLQPDDAREAWRQAVTQGGPVWLVIGDLAAILPGLRALGIAEPETVARTLV